MKFERNSPCPCGSGKKYKKCCLNVGFTDQNIITLDTCVCRSLINCRESPWYDVFCKMRDQGFQFCLADVCSVELMNQFISGQISPDQWRVMIGKLKRFISPLFPILPGKKQLFQIIGTEDKEQDDKDILDVGFEMEYSNALFQMMRKTQKSGKVIKEFVYKSKTIRYQTSNFITEIPVALQTERENWINQVKKHSNDYQMSFEDTVRVMKIDLDGSFQNSIPLSHRMDLLIKRLVDVSFMATKRKEPYNPCSQKRKNDGIDFVALFTIILPSRFCTLDHMKNCLQNLKSFQKDWVLKPQEIADLYNAGQLKRLCWDYHASTSQR